MTDTGLQLRSKISKDGTLEVSLAKVPVPEPKDDEVVVRVEATPINPSDLGLLFGPAEMSRRRLQGLATARSSPRRLRSRC
jgi:NADPH:quinone reductase-like Zn-dependent oxidoreductase